MSAGHEGTYMTSVAFVVVFVFIAAFAAVVGAAFYCW